MNAADQDPNNPRDDERTRDKERKTKKPRERDKEDNKKDNYEDSGGTNRATSREMIRQITVQSSGRFAGFSFLVYLFRLLSRPVTTTHLIKEFIAAINGNQENRLLKSTNYPSRDREGLNQTFVFEIYLAPIHPQTRNVSSTPSLGYQYLLNRIRLVLPQVFPTPENWKFTFIRAAVLSPRLCLATASTSQTSSPDIVIPAFPENENSNTLVAGGRNFRRALTRVSETSALVYQLFLLTQFRFDSVSEEILQQLINVVQRVLQYNGNPAINTTAGFIPALASGDNIQTTMLGVVYASGVVYGTVSRIPAASSRFGESSSLDIMAAIANPILGEGLWQMVHGGRQLDDYIAEGEHEAYVCDHVAENAEGNPNTDTLLKYPTQCEDPEVTPVSTGEYGWQAGQTEAPKGDLSNQENTCKFPVMETGWETNAKDSQDNSATDETNETTNAGVPIQCEEDLHSARHNNVSGSMSRDYANGARDSCSHGGARSRPTTQGRLQMRRAVLYAQCEEDLYYEYTWKEEEYNRHLRERLLCPECHASPWSVVLIPCGHLLCSYCYQGQRICPICLKEVVTSSHVLLS